MIGNYQYVKFIKGTPSAWESLSIKDSNTLYFISENNTTNGKLYLGEKLIADGGLEDNITLDKITSSLISAGNISDSLLVYDKDNGWSVQPVEAAIASAISVMSGASLDNDGKIGLVPAPKSEQYHMFLRGDGTWQDPAGSITGDITSLQSELHTLIGDNTDKSIEEIVNTSLTWGNF